MEKSRSRKKFYVPAGGKITVSALAAALALSSACFASPGEYLGFSDSEMIVEDSVHTEFDDIETYTETETESAETESKEDERALFGTELIEDREAEKEAAEPAVTDGIEAEETRVRVEGESEKRKLREEMVEFAKQFVGNPYVWGGTSLTDGADCSGFCLSVYAHFGITLPRVACDQAAAGTMIPLSEALPGDLIFYQDGTGYVYHVAMCSGEGMTVQAQNSRVGIVNTGMSGATFACRYFD